MKQKSKKTSKRRSAEILAVFTKHNFYSDGFTPEEMRTTLEDLGPTYVKIAQAHYGALKDGTRVVTKVQRPYIADMVRRDFVLLKKLASVVGVVAEASDGGQTVDLISVIGELEKVTEEELDFRVEAEHTRTFRTLCIEDESVISCPSVIDELNV